MHFTDSNRSIQMATRLIALCYPEQRTVTEGQIIMWASDAYDNGEIDYRPATLQESIRELEDLGHITVYRL